MARKESPENHLAAIAAVAAISLVLVQTITDRAPSSSQRYATRVAAEPSCTRSITAVTVGAIGATTASPVHGNCRQTPRNTGSR
jgi:hypothetical protein